MLPIFWVTTIIEAQPRKQMDDLQEIHRRCSGDDQEATKQLLVMKDIILNRLSLMALCDGKTKTKRLLFKINALIDTLLAGFQIQNQQLILRTSADPGLTRAALKACVRKQNLESSQVVANTRNALVSAWEQVLVQIKRNINRTQVHQIKTR